jgi:hypothetical protein
MLWCLQLEEQADLKKKERLQHNRELMLERAHAATLDRLEQERKVGCTQCCVHSQLYVRINTMSSDMYSHGL